MTLMDIISNAGDWMRGRYRPIAVAGALTGALIVAPLVVNHYASQMPKPKEPKGNAAIYIKREGPTTKEYWEGARRFGNLLIVESNGVKEIYWDNDPEQGDGVDIFSEEGKRETYVDADGMEQTPENTSLMGRVNAVYNTTVADLKQRTPQRYK